jgi:hypothetical protein
VADTAEPGEAKEEEADEEDAEPARHAKRARLGPEAHPMSVLLQLHAKDGATKAAIVFELWPSRGVVVPRVEEGDAALLAGILGEGAAEAAPPGADEGEASAAAPPAVLHWAQKLAGLDGGATDAAHAAAVVAALLAKAHA